MSKIADYLQILKVPPCAMNNSKVDSEARKRFFTKSRNFLAPGLQVRILRISRDIEEFWKFR